MNMKMLKAVIAGLVLSVSAFANAGLIIQFEEESGNLTSYQESGFSFDSLSGDFTLNDYSPAFGNQLYLSSASDSVRVTQVEGGLFDFMSLLFTDSNSNAIGTITSSNGGVYNTPGGIPGLVNFSGSDWMSVSYIDITRTGGTFFDIDNIEVMSATIPEPSTVAIFGLALMGLASRRFKK